MKAFSVEKSKINIYKTPVSMGCSFPKLTSLVDEWKIAKADSGELFLFFNKKFTYVKILFWARSGWCIFSKKLDKGRFHITDEKATITLTELNRLLESIVLHGGKRVSQIKVA